MINKSLLFVIFFLLSLLTYGQNTNTLVKGVVTDSVTNETIPYATIKVLAKDNPATMIKAVASDDNGAFEVTVNKSGDYLLSISSLGKGTLNIPFEVKGQKSVDLGKLNMKDDENALSEVVISADKPLVKVDLDKITYSMETDPEAKTNNVLDMLRKVPMVTVDGEENIQLKGSTNFKIYMNGKPSNMVSNNPKEVLRGMPANTVKDIEVITDPGAKYDAEGVAGIINIITQKQTSMGGYTTTLSSGVNSFGGVHGGIYLMLKYGRVGFTGNYNYNRYKNPRGNYSSFREDYNDFNTKYLYQNGTNKGNGNGQYGNGELSFELDTLNLINISFNRFEGRHKNYSDWITELQNGNHDTMYEYSRNGYSKGTFGGTGINVDYQRTFNKKDQLLTSSYRYNYNPNDSESDNDYKGINDPTNRFTRHDRQFTDANMKEHTFQIDFTTPFGKMHTVEAGVKYIIRLNKSNSGYDDLDLSSGIWIPRPVMPDNEFKHRQDIVAGYAGYSLKWQKWGFKTGLRYEATWLDAEFPIDENRNFKNDYSNVVPSVTATYQLKPTQTFRLGYNMRISRPGIWQLNPYENTSDSSYIRRGNPELDAEKSHSLSLNYSYFNPKLNINTNLSYNFADNSIQSITELINGVNYTTYDNIGKRKNVYLSVYVNWSITNKLRLYSNLGGSYTDIRTNNDENLSNHGFNTNLYAGLQYNLPKDWDLYANAGYFSPQINLQGKGSSFNYNVFRIQKGFLDKRLIISAFAFSPFAKNMSFKNTENRNTDYYFESNNEYRRRQFGIRVSFRFGELKTQLKKTRRSIVNDDMSGAGGGQGSAGGQGSGQGGGGQQQ